MSSLPFSEFDNLNKVRHNAVNCGPVLSHTYEHNCVECPEHGARKCGYTQHRERGYIPCKLGSTGEECGKPLTTPYQALPARVSGAVTTQGSMLANSKELAPQLDPRPHFRVGDDYRGGDFYSFV